MGNRISANADTYWCDFHEKLTEMPSSLISTINTLNQMIDDIILDYKMNNDLIRSCHLLQKLDKSVEEFFDNKKDHPFDPIEIENLTRLCRRLNEDHILQEIRDSTLEEREYGEYSKKLPRFGSQIMPSVNNIKITDMRPQFNPKLRDMVKQMSYNYLTDVTHKLNVPVFNSMTNIKPLRLKRIDAIQDMAEMKELREASTMSEMDGSPPEKFSGSKINLKFTRGSSKETIKQQIDALFDQMRFEYHEQRIDFAHDILNELKEFIKTNELDKWVDGYINSKIEYKTLMDDIIAFYNQMSDLSAEFEDEDGYHSEAATDNVLVKYKKLPKGKIVIKLEAVLDVQLFQLLALLNEVEKYPTWSSYCKESKEMKKIHKTAKALWMKWELPKPLGTKESLMMGVGFDRMSINGSVLILFRTINNDKTLLKRYNMHASGPSKATNLDIEIGGIELIPLAKHKTIYKQVMVLDPKTRVIPASIISWTARKGAIDMFEKLEKVAADIKINLYQRNTDKNEFSGWLQKFLAQYFDYINE